MVGGSGERSFWEMEMVGGDSGWKWWEVMVGEDGERRWKVMLGGGDRLWRWWEVVVGGGDGSW